jgi:hypothetical protein
LHYVSKTQQVEGDAKICANLIDTMTGLFDVSLVDMARSEPEAFEWLTGYQGQWTLTGVEFFIPCGAHAVFDKTNEIENLSGHCANLVLDLVKYFE